MMGRFTLTAVSLEAFLGFLTFTGSLMAFGKLQGLISGAPLTYRGQNATNIGLFLAALGLVIWLVVDPTHTPSSTPPPRSASWSASSSCCRSAAPTCRW
jgi:NAD(P) transhydrogenase subunit beta